MEALLALGDLCLYEEGLGNHERCIQALDLSLARMATTKHIIAWVFTYTKPTKQPIAFHI